MPVPSPGTDFRTDRVGSALAGTNPTVLARLDASFADAFLHAHVWPRFDWEPAERVGRAVWSYPESSWSDPADALGPQHEELRARLVRELQRVRPDARRDEQGAGS